jgi:DNA-binding NarL/FixJ family response regulator
MTHRILVVTSDPQRLAPFADSLKASQEIHVAWADSGAAALADVKKHPPIGVIVDENLPDMPGLELVRRLLPINAMINTAVISNLSDAAFHETSEGLGILARLPPVPTESQARKLLTQLKRLHVAAASGGTPPARA